MGDTTSDIQMLPFEVPFWAKGAHAQTLLGHILRRPIKLSGVKQLDVPLPDGDQLASDHYIGTSDTVVYLFHGLGGSIDQAYMSRVAKSCLDAGHSVYLTNHRGCGRGAQLSCRQIYHAGRAEDLSAVISLGRRTYPNKKHIAVGFSLSGNAVLLLAAKRRGTSFPDAVISVNAPLDLRAAAQALSAGFNRIYDIHFVLQLSKDISEKRKKGWVKESARIPITGTVYDADVVLATLPGGLGDRETYYKECSSGQYLKDIQIPTIMITAKDDPFVDSGLYFQVTRSPQVRIMMTEKGGHMGYVRREGLYGISHWLDTVILETVQKLLKREF